LRKGEFLVHRFAITALLLSLVLGLSGSSSLFAQDEAKKDQAPKAEPSKPEAAKPEASKDTSKDKEKSETPKSDASAATESLPPIPPEVEAKLEAARRAVAEAIVAAQDAGLVKTTIDPPPILDILITGRANDEMTLKARTGVSPEVLGAWFTGYGTTKDITPQKDVRITNPSAGLKDYYDQRASILNRHIEAVRKALSSAKKEEPKAEVKKEEPKAETAKEGDKEPKKEEPKAEVKKEEPKAETAKEGDKEPKKEEPKEGEAKKDNPGGDTPKDEAKKDDKKGDGSKDDAPK